MYVLHIKHDISMIFCTILVHAIHLMKCSSSSSSFCYSGQAKETIKNTKYCDNFS